MGAKHYQASAEQNERTEELFLDLCKRMTETAQVGERAKGSGSSQQELPGEGTEVVEGVFFWITIHT